MKILQVESVEGHAKVSFTYKELCILTNNFNDVALNSGYRDDVDFQTLRRDIALLAVIAKDGILTKSGVNMLNRLQHEIDSCKEKDSKNG